jgi:hypothetical protein
MVPSLCKIRALRHCACPFRRRIWIGAALLALAPSPLLLSACVPSHTAPVRVEALLAARVNGMVTERIPVGWTDLTVSHRGLATGNRLVVYVEGDGHAWEDRTTPSADPTPDHPVALALAARDPAPAVLYLARPCQFGTGKQLPRGCATRHWTAARFSPEVLSALKLALKWATDHWQSPPRLGIVGFSGGGVLAALLATDHAPVEWLATVAAPLDPDHWTTHHHVSPLTDPLSPMDRGAGLAPLPQVHFVGGQDETVPLAVVASYLRSLPAPRDARVELVPTASHTGGWSEIWPRPLCAWLDARAGLKPWHCPSAPPPKPRLD